METLKNLTLVQWIGIMIGLNSLLMGATPQLTVLFGTAAVPIIVAVATLGNGALGVFVTVIGGLGSQARNVVAGGASIAVGPNASASLATLAMDPAQSKIDAAPGASAAVAAIAKSAAVLLLSILIVGAALPAHAATKAPVASKMTKTQALTNPLSVIQTFTESDLTAALTDAKANNDLAAVNCYTALLPIVQSGVANPLPAGLGGFQLLQKARDLKTMLANLQSPNGPMAQLNLACAPLVLDVQNTMVLLGVVGGGVALTGGAGGLALPGLGALIPGL